MILFTFLFNKVGEDEEKLAHGIKLYAVSATTNSKRTMLSDLVTVSFYNRSTLLVNSCCLLF